jgi:uncharacterized integral membrane protein (TIGR00698 family)
VHKLISSFVKGTVPGVLVSVVVAVAAQFLSDHYGAPAMLMALLLGLALHFLAEDGRCAKGINFSAGLMLRLGVALLGARISVALLIGLGPGLIVLVVGAVVLTMIFGLMGARLLKRGWRLALLTGGSVAICGVSAAMAIAAALPKNEHSERNLIFTVLGVTILSTVAMIGYPILSKIIGLDERATGVFLGGTIHDVAQVVGAGFSVSQLTGETATVVKLIRVMLLGPTVILLSLIVRSLDAGEHRSEKRPPLVPGFILGFVALASLNSIGAIPSAVADILGDVSRWALLVAIAAVGVKTSFRRVLDVGGAAIVLIIAETVFIAGLILIGIAILT